MRVEDFLESPLERERVFLDLDAKSLQDYKEGLAQRIRGFHLEAGSPSRLLELEAQIVVDGYHDVKRVEKSELGEKESLGLQWNFRDEEFGTNRFEAAFSSVVVTALLNGDLIVRGKRTELITLERWRYNGEVLADAIAYAYKNPSVTVLALDKQHGASMF